jgi:hypothetical protein
MSEWAFPGFTFSLDISPVPYKNIREKNEIMLSLYISRQMVENVRKKYR